MKILFTTLFAVLISVGAVTAQDAEFVSGPKIQFEKTTYDFGANPQGTPVSCEFVFKNVGTEPLVLQNVKASCGCTTPFWPKEPIKIFSIAINGRRCTKLLDGAGPTLSYIKA